MRLCRCDRITLPPARVHVTDTDDVPDTDDADADTDDDAGPCEDIVVLAKTHSGASEDTYCGSATSTFLYRPNNLYLSGRPDPISK